MSSEENGYPEENNFGDEDNFGDFGEDPDFLMEDDGFDGDPFLTTSVEIKKTKVI